MAPSKAKTKDRDRGTHTPLAERMRPRTLRPRLRPGPPPGQGQAPGRAHRVEPARLHRSSGARPAPARRRWRTMLAGHFDLPCEFFSAVLSGIKEVKEFMARAEQQRRLYGKPMVLFIDEIHRFNKAQQGGLPALRRERATSSCSARRRRTPPSRSSPRSSPGRGSWSSSALDRRGPRPHPPGRPRGRGARARRGRPDPRSGRPGHAHRFRQRRRPPRR
ncbi:MAG: hypothetical protein M0C28_02615 [Candidatus Moduliflexus flocculans]|nr:hypothetical protein [Candidatus Moduliflexus flocculans]